MYQFELEIDSRHFNKSNGFFNENKLQAEISQEIEKNKQALETVRELNNSMP